MLIEELFFTHKTGSKLSSLITCGINTVAGTAEIEVMWCVDEKWKKDKGPFKQNPGDSS